jgi:hypothetical protein
MHIVSIGQSSCLQIQRSGLDFRYYHIFWEVVGLEQGHPSSWIRLIRYADYATSLNQQKIGTNFADKRLSLGRSVDIVRPRTKTTLLLLVFFINIIIAIITAYSIYKDRLCGLVVRVLGYRSGGPGSIPGTTWKKSSWSGTGSTQPREYNWGATW